MLNILLTAALLISPLNITRKIMNLPFSPLDKSHRKIKIGRPISRNYKKRYRSFFSKGFLIHLLLHRELELKVISLFIPVIVHKT